MMVPRIFVKTKNHPPINYIYGQVCTSHEENYIYGQDINYIYGHIGQVWRQVCWWDGTHAGQVHPGCWSESESESYHHMQTCYWSESESESYHYMQTTQLKWKQKWKLSLYTNMLLKWKGKWKSYHYTQTTQCNFCRASWRLWTGWNLISHYIIFTHWYFVSAGFPVALNHCMDREDVLWSDNIQGRAGSPSSWALQPSRPQ